MVSWHSLGRRMVSLNFVTLQVTESAEHRMLKSSIFSKLILGEALEKYSYHLMHSSFILLLD